MERTGPTPGRTSDHWPLTTINFSNSLEEDPLKDGSFLIRIMINFNKFSAPIVTWLLLLQFSCADKDKYNPDNYLSPKQKDAIITTIVRYSAKKPANVSDKEVFNVKYDSFYLERASQMRFERYFPKDDYFYFLISQPAASLIEKRHATGGRFKLTDKGELAEYEEIFRTWKMVPDTLQLRSYLLFEKMVEGKPLEQYYTKNAKGVDYIEFPDDRTYYDVRERSWKVKQ